jgi:uncharacterized coiled-coil protein SlyX
MTSPNPSNPLHSTAEQRLLALEIKVELLERQLTDLAEALAVKPDTQKPEGQ